MTELAGSEGLYSLIECGSRDGRATEPRDLDTEVAAALRAERYAPLAAFARPELFFVLS